MRDDLKDMSEIQATQKKRLEELELAICRIREHDMVVSARVAGAGAGAGVSFEFCHLAILLKQGKTI